MNRDLLHPSVEQQRQTHKLKRLIPTPNSYFMDVKCGGCSETNVVFSHAQSVIACNNCKNVLTKPTGGKCMITEGSAFKVKHWSVRLIQYPFSIQRISKRIIWYFIPSYPKFIPSAYHRELMLCCQNNQSIWLFFLHITWFFSGFFFLFFSFPTFNTRWRFLCKKVAK